VAWHPPPDAPPGIRHGSAAVCVAGDAVVLVSGEGDRWGLPGGRPEPGEDWADTLRREVREEACATVTACRLLGFSRGVCVRGSQAGLVLVRALWRAEVRPDPWQPRLEIVGRRLVPVAEAFDSIWIEDGFEPLYRRIFVEARFPSGRERAVRQRAAVCGATSASTVSSPVGGDCRVGAPAASRAWTVPG
jgi:ADP-ribose pyrophosphatase YjhB (NUDIX family)